MRCRQGTKDLHSPREKNPHVLMLRTRTCMRECRSLVTPATRHHNPVPCLSFPPDEETKWCACVKFGRGGQVWLRRAKSCLLWMSTGVVGVAGLCEWHWQEQATMGKTTSGYINWS